MYGFFLGDIGSPALKYSAFKGATVMARLEARDTPRLDVFHPVVISFLPILGHRFRGAVIKFSDNTTADLSDLLLTGLLLPTF